LVKSVTVAASGSHDHTPSNAMVQVGKDDWQRRLL